MFPFFVHAQCLVKGKVYNANTYKVVSVVKISISPIQKILITDGLGGFQTKLKAGNYQIKTVAKQLIL